MLGVGAQWIAWRFRLPSILLLLLAGFLAGPVTGLLDPQMLQGDWVFPFVALSVGIILFEGGLSLQLDELREVGKAVFNLITVGVLVTWALAALAAYHLLGFDLELSLIIGAILTVTGPTVVIPLLRHIRPSGRVGTIAKWEGITVDPIGAILAVLVLETVLLLHEPVKAASGMGVLSEAAVHAIQGLLLEAFIGLGVGISGAAALLLLLRRRLVPDYLQNPLALMVVVAVFALSDVLQEESGLVATTVMGIAVANQHFVPVRRIVEFKEDVRVLLLSFLFIILSARLELADLQYLGVGAFLFLGVLMLVVRPAAVYLSSIGTQLKGKELLFLSWMAPRGVVAAAVASLFSFRLQELYPTQADSLVPLIFLVIVGTVAIYGLTIGPLARWLGLAHPAPQGVMFVGAHAWARRLAEVLAEHDFKVVLVDSNPQNIKKAKAMELTAQHENVLSEGVMDHLDLSGIGRLLALTPNDEVNSLVALHFAEIFDTAELYQLSAREENGNAREGLLPRHLRGRPLFGPGATFMSLSDRFEAGAEIKVIQVEESFSYKEFTHRYGDTATPLFLIRGPQQLYIYAEKSNAPTLQPGQILVALVDANVQVENNPALAEEV